MPLPGGPELIIILVIILLLFGAKKIPELAKGLGTGVREFKRGTQEDPKVENKEEDKKEEELHAAAEADAEATSENGTDTESRLQEDASVEADKAEQKQH